MREPRYVSAGEGLMSPLLLGPLSCIIALVIAGCGGDSAEDSGADGQQPNDAATQDNAESGALDGPLVYVSGIGLFSIDATTGAGEEFPFSDVEDAAINVEPAVDGDNAYVLTYTTIPGESYSHTVYLSRVQRSTGNDERFSQLGVDREDDEAEELWEYPELVVAAGDVWVIKELFGAPGSEVILRVDGTTGEVVSTLPRPRARGMSSDGDRIYLWSEAGIDMLDPTTESFDTLIPNGAAIGELLAENVDLNRTLITESGMAPTRDDIEFLARTPLDSRSLGTARGSTQTPLHFLAYRDGALWLTWDVTSGTHAGETALAEAILRLDIDSRRIDGIAPTVEFGEHFLDGEITNGHGDFAWYEGAIWVIDPQSNGAVMRIEPSTLTAEIAHEPCGGGDFICSDADAVVFNRTDPDSLWLRFARSVDEGGGSSGGEIFIQELDASGQLVQEIPVKQLLDR